jgi:hypothetical protein
MFLKFDRHDMKTRNIFSNENEQIFHLVELNAITIFDCHQIIKDRLISYYLSKPTSIGIGKLTVCL